MKSAQNSVFNFNKREDSGKKDSKIEVGDTSSDEHEVVTVKNRPVR